MREHLDNYEVTVFMTDFVSSNLLNTHLEEGQGEMKPNIKF